MSEDVTRLTAASEQTSESDVWAIEVIDLCKSFKDFHADLFGIPRKQKKERITKLLELVQLLDRKDSRVGTFSGGMKRRLALARALLHDPQLIYLDEPTLGVDVQARRAIWDYILSLRDKGKTVLITTNYLEEAQALCERVAIIDRGASYYSSFSRDRDQRYYHSRARP